MSAKMNEKKNQKEQPIDIVQIKKKLKPFTKPQNMKNFDLAPHKLVEIYHNNAARESDSEEERNKSKIQMKGKNDAVPHLNISGGGHDCGDFKKTPGTHYGNPEEGGYEEPQAPRNYYANKSYELPTIASKMKQAVKLDFNMFNFKAIPFCPVSSTTPSHNIGINIQQVMSIIKTRQPVNGISPTLAHNINLAAEKLNNDPLTSFVSSMTSKMGYGKSQCPLNKYSLNYRHLEEMARAVPEETVEEVNDQNIREGAGDMEINGPPSPSQWLSDNNRKNCTCSPTTGVDFNQIYNKYRSQPPETFDQKTRNLRPPSTPQPMYRRTTGVSRRIRSFGYVEEQQNRNNQNQNNYYQYHMANNTNQAPYNTQESMSPLNGREKKLKDVLMNLHDDFDAMNKRYEFLSSRVSTNEANQEEMREFEELEHQMNKKEEEINIVMTLYKEVLALKEQVRALKRFSECTTNHMYRRLRPDNYSSRTAHHIAKILQQMKDYQ